MKKLQTVLLFLSTISLCFYVSLTDCGTENGTKTDEVTDINGAETQRAVSLTQGRRFRRHTEQNEGMVVLPRNTDVWDLVGSLIRKLKWKQVFILGSKEVDTGAIFSYLDGVSFQYHVAECDVNVTSPLAEVSLALEKTMAELEGPNIIVAGYNICIQEFVFNWFTSIPLRIGLGSSLVQDSRWLLVVDGHVVDTIPVTSCAINNVAILETEPDTNQVRLNTLTWKPQGRVLEKVKGVDLTLELLDDSVLFPNVKYGLSGQHMRWRPYIMKVKTPGDETDGYVGYSVDLLNLFAKILNFSYSLHMPADGEWGDYRDGKWTGVVGQIDRQEVDFSVAPLTPKVSRGSVVDWASPFKFRYTGLAVVTSSSDTSHLVTALLKPFTWQVYAAVAVAFLVITCVMMIMLTSEARMASYLRLGKPSLSTIFAYLLASFLREGIPSALSSRPGVSRPLVAFWGLFAVLVTSLYTSKLTSLLVDVSPPPPFRSMAEMVQSGEFRWGVVGGTALLQSLRDSNNSVMKAVYKGMMTFVQDDPDVLSLYAEVHRAKVVAGGYVYIGEEGLLNLWAAEDYNIRVIREKVVGMETYNVFTPKHSAMTKRIDQVLLELGATGVLTSLQDKWWPKKISSKGDNNSGSTQTISLETMQGVFYTAVAGAILAAFVLLAEKFLTSKAALNWFPEAVLRKIMRKRK